MERHTRLWIGLAIALVLLVVGGIWLYNALTEDTTELSTVTGDLAFMSDQTGNWDLFMLAPDGTLTNITAENPEHDYVFNFDFSGDLINFRVSNEGEENMAIVNSDGTGLKTYDSYIPALMDVISSQNFDMDPSWSPDGSTIAWTKIVPLSMGTKVYTANADFSGEQKLAGEGSIDTMQAWSPDGAQIVYASDAGAGESNIYKVDVATGDLTQLTDDEPYDAQPVWSLDGTQIMYISNHETDFASGEFEFWVMNADGSDLHRLGADEVFTGDPTYSPDGTQVAYMSNESGTWQIYVMDTDGENVQQITEDGTNNIFPAWRPIPADAAE